MLEVFKDPVVLTAFAAFAGAVVPVFLGALFKALKAKAAKTENTIDDAMIEAIEGAVLKAIKK